MSRELDLSKFKKVSVTKEASVLAHPDGHEFKIAHKGLNPQLLGQLQKLKIHNYASGGKVAGTPEVPDAPDGYSQEVATPKDLPGYAQNSTPYQQDMTKIFGNVPGQDRSFENPIINPGASTFSTPAESPGTPASGVPFPSSPPMDQPGKATSFDSIPSAASAPQDQQQAGAQPPINKDPYGLMAANRRELGGVGTQEEAANQAAAAQGELGQRQAPIEQQFQQQMTGVNNSFQQHFNNLQHRFHTDRTRTAEHHAGPFHLQTRNNSMGNISNLRKFLHGN